MWRKLIHYMWAISWGILMLLLMGLPSDDMPGVGFFEGFDKMAHCGFFFVFTALLLIGAISANRGKQSKIKTIFLAVLVSSFLAFGTEAMQYYFDSGRQADWWDIFADYTGIGMAIFGYMLFYRRQAV